MKFPQIEQGIVLLILVMILALASAGYMLKSLDSEGIRNERDKKTNEALAEAKAALLGFGASQNLTPGVCTTNCPRPGDLPCPDTDNNGIAEVSCGNAAGTTQQASRLGRLPWITLGLPDLRDGDGERLWYAVSSNYKNNARFRPLNSDTLATITLRDNNGNIIFNGTNNGLAAVVIAPGAAFVRQDNIYQARDGANQLIASNYLDVALGEDNQNFVDSNINGFIVGPVKDVNGRTVVNDRMLGITRNDMNQMMETRVLTEVRDSLVTYFSGAGAFSYPRPANFNIATCLGSANINSPNCPEGTSTHGRIPANPVTPWSATSVLRGVRNGNWFQLNAWREVIHYAAAPACITGTTNCDGAGFLTLNNSQILPTNTKQLVLIATGAGVGLQVRTTNANRTTESNYLENDNLLPLPPDDIYTKSRPLTPTNNDRVTSLP